MPAETLTVDSLLEQVERFIVEVDAIAWFETIRNGNVETPLQQHISEVAAELQHFTLGQLSEEEDERLYERGKERGRELARELIKVPCFRATAEGA